MEAHKRAKLEKQRAKRGSPPPTKTPNKIMLEMRKSIQDEAKNLQAAFDAVSGESPKSPKAEPGRDEFVSVVLIDQLSRAGTRVNELLEAMDSDGDGEIDEYEFHAFVSEIIPPQMQHLLGDEDATGGAGGGEGGEALSKVFEALDTDGNGAISRAELEAALSPDNAPELKRQVSELISQGERSPRARPWQHGATATKMGQPASDDSNGDKPNTKPNYILLLLVLLVATAAFLGAGH